METAGLGDDEMHQQRNQLGLRGEIMDGRPVRPDNVDPAERQELTVRINTLESTFLGVTHAAVS